MKLFPTGALRPATGAGRSASLSAAEDLVQRTLAQHGLSTTPTTTGPDSLMHRVLSGSATAFQKPTAPAAPLPEGAQFLTAHQAGQGGGRAYRTYVPASAQDGARNTATGIVMMLHGCTQTPEDFATGTGMNALADAGSFIVIYPEQSRGANAQTCWNWFSPNDQRRDRGEPRILAEIARAAQAEYDVSPDRTFVAGLSAGGAMAVIMGRVHPETFGAVGVHSGLPFGAANNVASAFAAMGGNAATPRAPDPAPQERITDSPRTIVFHGTSDSTVHPSNGEAVARDADWHGPAQSVQTIRHDSTGGRETRITTSMAEGQAHLEHWVIEGLGHAWSGGQRAGSYTDPAGPDASAEMVRFFFEDRT